MPMLKLRFLSFSWVKLALNDRESIDAFAGAQYVYIDGIGDSFFGSQEATIKWVSPIIALRYNVKATGKMVISAYAGIADFHDSDTRAYDFSLSSKYKFTKKLTGEIGYRNKELRFKKSDEDLYFKFHGPFIKIRYLIN